MQIRDIPGAPGYKITEQAVVIKPDGIPTPSRTNSNGYRIAAIYVPGIGSVTNMIHNLMARAFIGPPPVDDGSYLANHFDLDKCNNHPSNLEWVTHNQNYCHQVLLNNPESLRLSLTGKPEDRISLKEISEQLGLTYREVWEKVKSGEIKYLNKYAPKKEHDAGVFRLGCKLPKGFHKKKPIWIKDIESGEVTEYESTSAAARSRGIEATAINVYLWKPGLKIRLLQKKFIVSASNEFPDTSDLDMSVRLYTAGRPVIAYSVGMDTIFLDDSLDHLQEVVMDSGTSFVKKYGLPRASTLKRIKDGKIKPVNGWIVLNQSPENKQRLIEYIKKLKDSYKSK